MENDKEELFHVFLSYKSISSLDVPSDFEDEILWTNKDGLKLLKSIFRIVKSEMSEFAYMMRSEAKSDSDKYIEIIANDFGVNRDDFNEKILKRIKKLKQFHFRSGGLTIYFDEIVEKIKSLRFSRIKFWENLLKNFNENEDFYLSKLEQKKENQTEYQDLKN